MEENSKKTVKNYGELEKEANTKEMKVRQQKKLTGGSITISTTVSQDFWRLAKQHNLSWSEALRVGLSIQLADKGHMQYDNKLNLWRKMNFFRQEAEKAVEQIEELTKKIAEREGIKIGESKKTP